ncbi:MAG: helix-turn-helix transcriptional regulator [Phycisphaerae bacterium]
MPTFRRDLYELYSLLATTQDSEEIAQAQVGVLEILDVKPTGMKPLDLKEKPLDEVTKWGLFVGKKIRKLRQARGWTQKVLAQKSRLPQSHISRLEVGKHSPGFLTVDRLAAALDVAVGELDPTR